MNDTRQPSTVSVLVSDGIAPAGIDLLKETPGFEVTFRTGMSPEERRATGELLAFPGDSLPEAPADGPRS